MHNQNAKELASSFHIIKEINHKLQDQHRAEEFLKLFSTHKKWVRYAKEIKEDLQKQQLLNQLLKLTNSQLLPYLSQLQQIYFYFQKKYAESLLNNVSLGLNDTRAISNFRRQINHKIKAIRSLGAENAKLQEMRIKILELKTKYKKRDDGIIKYNLVRKSKNKKTESLPSISFTSKYEQYTSTSKNLQQLRIIHQQKLFKKITNPKIYQRVKKYKPKNSLIWY